jgi:hypothetical protein
VTPQSGPHSGVGLGFPSSAFGTNSSINGQSGQQMRSPSLLGGPPRSPYNHLQANGASNHNTPSTADHQVPGTPSLFPPTPTPDQGSGAGMNGNGNGGGMFEQQQDRMVVSKKDD